MKASTGTSLGVAISLSWVCVAALAQAQDAEAPPSVGEVRAPHSAFEIGAEAGYTQPFGEIGDGVAIGDVAEAGGAVGLSVGYRFTPRWALALLGQFHESAVSDRLAGNVNVRGVTAGLVGTYHIRPYERVDPYLSLGTGYRAMFIARHDGPSETLHAVQLARGIVGVDFRVSEDIALGPLVGADLDLFVSNARENGANRSIDAVRPSTFLFAGVGGRFDVGGSRVASDYDQPVPAAAPPTGRAPTPTTGVKIDKGILAKCSITTPRAYFEFDSSDVKSRDASTLDAVAECFTVGALKGRSMRVVGHADPRGTNAYNDDLGQSRADAVMNYMVVRGVSSANVETVSRGELDSNEDPDEFAFDRRVDMRLVDE